MVIAIIAVLMSILMPALDRAKEQAKDVICRSQLHQWGLIWKMITDDNNGNFFIRDPDMDFWMETVAQNYDTDVSSAMWLCPNATKTLQEGGRNPYLARDEWRGDPPVYYVASYGVNFWVSNEIDNNYWRTPSMRGASYGPIFVDAMETDMEPEPTDQPLPAETMLWEESANEMQRCNLKRHGKYFVNVLFMDWSVKRRTVKEMWRVRWHKNWPANADLPVWPAWLSNVPEPVY